MRELLSLLWPYVKRHKIYFILLNLTSILAATAQTFIPIGIGRIIDEIIPAKDLGALKIAFFGLIGLTLLDMLSQSSQRFAGVKFSQNIIFDIRQDLFIALQNQELDYYAQETTGQIMSRSINEIFSLRDILTWAYRITVLVIFLFAGALITMLNFAFSGVPNQNYGTFYLATVFLIIPIIIATYIIKTSEKNREIFYRTRFVYGEMSDTMAENLAGIHTVKSFGREDEQVQLFNIKNQEFYSTALKGAKIRGTMMPGIIFVIGTALIILVFVGGYFVFIGSITPGNFVTFMLLALQIAIPGRFVGWVGIVAQDADSAAVRLNEIFKSKVGIQNTPHATELVNVKGKINFENVTFNYPAAHHTLHEINLTINPGEKVALLGSTGSGKSTLISLIPRFYDPIEGVIKIDDTNIKDVTIESLRHHIAIVHQDAFLFTMSIHDNIAFGRPRASREEVIESAKAAQIHDFIETLEEGYDTIVGERGVTLSGGQRQRVTIARAILKDPKILIFDDSVSAVDPTTEAQIQKNLENSSKNRTTIIISQRPSSLRYVDRILVLEKGHIVQNGTHEQLIKQTGIYQDFIEAVNKQIKFMDWNRESEIEITEGDK